MNLEKMKIEITDLCSLQCQHCSSNAGPECNQILQFPIINSVLKEFQELGGKKLVISGGEPLTHPDLDQILQLSNKIGLETVLYSSGILLKNNRYIKVSNEIFSKLKIYINKIIFSIYGNSDKIHDAITKVPGSYNLTWKSIKKSIKFEIETEIHFVPTPLNYHSIPSVIKKANSEGIKRISFLRFVPQGRGKLHKDEMTFNKQQLIEFKRIIKYCRTNIQNIEIRTESPFNILLPKKITPCMAGINQLYITSDGNIFPCDAFKQYKFNDSILSNIKNDSLKEIWISSPFLKKTREALQSPFSLICSDCVSLEVCQGGCLAQKVMSSSTFNEQPDPDCLLN